MSKSVVTLTHETTNRDAFLCMEAERVKAAPVVDGVGRVVGVLTRDDAVRLELLAPSVDKHGALMVGAAVGISSDAADRAQALVEMGVDVLVLDTAHGHQRRMIEAIRAVRARVGPDVPIAAGNVCTAKGTRALVEAGADIVKVNVGPGAMCTTRMQTGVGRPRSPRSWHAPKRSLGKHVWADGGSKTPEMSHYVGCGRFKGHGWYHDGRDLRSPGDIKKTRGALYKVNFGMAVHVLYATERQTCCR